MTDTITAFSLQALRFQRADFNIGLASDAAESRSPKNSAAIEEAFVYLAANTPTVLPSWVMNDPTFDFYKKHGLLTVYDKAPSELTINVETAAAVAMAKAKAAESGSDADKLQAAADEAKTNQNTAAALLAQDATDSKGGPVKPPALKK